MESRRNRSRTTGRTGGHFEGLCSKVQADVDSAATEAALDRLLANGVVLGHQLGARLEETQCSRCGENSEVLL